MRLICSLVGLCTGWVFVTDCEEKVHKGKKMNVLFILADDLGELLLLLLTSCYFSTLMRKEASVSCKCCNGIYCETHFLKWLLRSRIINGLGSISSFSLLVTDITTVHDYYSLLSLVTLLVLKCKVKIKVENKNITMHLIHRVILGWNDIGYHNPEFKTPYLDSLAKTGRRLNHLYYQPGCTPWVIVLTLVLLVWLFLLFIHS